MATSLRGISHKCAASPTQMCHFPTPMYNISKTNEHHPDHECAPFSTQMCTIPNTDVQHPQHSVHHPRHRCAPSPTQSSLFRQQPHLPGVQRKLLLVVLHELSQVEQRGDNLGGDGGRGQGRLQGSHQSLPHGFFQLRPTRHKAGGKQLPRHAGLNLRQSPGWTPLRVFRTVRVCM